MQFLYLILSIYYGRRNPLYYFIFPIALVSGPGLFVDERTCLIAPEVFTHAKNIYKDVIVIYLGLVVLFKYKCWHISVIKKSPINFYSIYLLIISLLTFIKYGNEYEALYIIRLYFNMVLGFYFIALIFSTATLRQFEKFINILFLANGILSIAYVLNSSNIIPMFYQGTIYQEIDYGNSVFYRDFQTIPYFSHLLFMIAISVKILNVRTFNKKLVTFTICSYPGVLLFTFTRSLLISTCIELIVIIVILLKSYPRTLFKLKVLSFLSSGVILLISLTIIFPNESNYFVNRIDLIEKKGTKESNVAIRILYHVKAYSILERSEALYGGYAMNKRYEKEMNRIGAWSADSTIPFLLINTGIIGVIIYFYILMYYAIRSLRYFIKLKDPLLLALSVILITSIASSLLMGGIYWGDPFLFFPFALITYRTNNKTLCRSNPWLFESYILSK